jgi:hypothetical protein
MKIVYASKCGWRGGGGGFTECTTTRNAAWATNENTPPSMPWPMGGQIAATLLWCEARTHSRYWLRRNRGSSDHLARRAARLLICVGRHAGLTSVAVSAQSRCVSTNGDTRFDCRVAFESFLCFTVKIFHKQM